MLNIMDGIFLGIALVIAITGFLMRSYEKHVPVYIVKVLRYGSFAYHGSSANLIRTMEIPKSYFQHFYLFSTAFSIFALIHAILVYFCGYEVLRFVTIMLKLLLHQEKPAVSVLASMAALSLIAVQCIKRCYEAYRIQVFAKSSKIHVIHYAFGILHYFAVVLAIVGQAPLFCGDNNRDKVLWTDLRTIIVLIPGIPIFLWAWLEQHKSNLILANLRKDRRSGQVVTEEYKVPHGRLFESISSPHRYCEIILYTVLLSIIPTKTFFCIFLWVLSNQVHTAVQSHEWYKTTFKKYPAERYAIFKGIL